jgi:signal transduction histidine kinase
MNDPRAKTPGPQSDFERELRDVNEALLVSSVRQHELIETAQKAEAELRQSEHNLATELDAARRLQEISTQLIHPDDGEALYGQILDAAVAIMHSEFASMQMLVPERGGGELRLLAFRGFDPQAAKFWGSVGPTSACSCGRALGTGGRVIVGDIERCDWMAGTEDQATYRNTGIRAVQSTPLISRTGGVLGIISTHWRRPHEPTAGELRLMDILARQAADLIDRKKSDTALRQSEERFRALFDLGPVAVYACDVSGVIQEFNRRAAELWGRAPAAGDTDERFCCSFKLYRPDGSLMPHPLCPMAEVVSGKIPKVRDAEVLIERPDGSRVTVIVNIQPLKNERGEVTGAINCFYDITERKQTEEALDMARDQAESANRAKDKFLAVLSHELRTPLTPVMMTITAMDMNPGLPPDIRGDVAMIRRNVELEARLIDDLLDLSCITSGKLRLQFDILDVNELVCHVCKMCQGNMFERGIQLHNDLDENAHAVVGDAGRLQQVLWNLLNNATKFTPEGGHIYVTTENVAPTGEEGHAGQVRVTVRDTGIGIPPEILPRIFDAFEQGDTRITRQFGGLGLGLSISRLLVEQHRGSIRARTDGPNQGSTFVVELPALIQHPAPSPGKSVPRDDDAIGPLRVLVVEDHADTAAVLSKLLTARGHAVRTAVTAADALSLASRHTFDVIVSDLGLPDATGYVLMEQIKGRYGIKGIAMSGYGMEEDIRKSEQAGFSDHIVKPVSITQLEQSIRRVAGNGR